MITKSNEVVKVTGKHADHPYVRSFWEKMIRVFKPSHPIWDAIGEDDWMLSEIVMGIIVDFEETFEEFTLRASTKVGLSQGIKLSEEIRRKFQNLRNESD